MTRSPRPPVILYCLLFGWAALAFGYYAAGVAGLREIWFRGDRHGTLAFDHDEFGRVTNAGKTNKEIRNGDILIALDGKPYVGDIQSARLRNRAKPGDITAVTVRHADGSAQTVPVRLHRTYGPPMSGTMVTYLVGILLVPLLSLAIGFWVVAARPSDPNAWLVLVILTLPEVAFGDLQASWWPGFWHALFNMWARVCELLWFPALAWFGLFFPERSRIDIRWPWLKWALFPLQIYCLGFYEWLQYLHMFDISRLARTAGVEAWSDSIQQNLEIVAVVIFLAAILEKLRSASTADARRRLRVLALGSGLSLGPLVLIFTLLPRFGLDPHHGVLYMLVTPLLALFPLTLAYVLVVQRAMDIRVLLRMGTGYLLAKATLIVLEIAIATFLVLYFVVPMMQRSQNQTTSFVLLAAIVAGLFAALTARDRLSGRMQRWLDRKFFRESYNAEAILSELSEHARTFTEKAPLIENVSRRVSEVLHVPQIAVWLKGNAVFQLQQTIGFEAMGPVLLAGDSATVTNLTRTNLPARVYRDRPDNWLVAAGPDEISALDQVRAEVLLPLPGRDRLMGVMALGPKKSEEPYTPSDLRVLQSVATQTGLALEVSELAHSLATEAAQRARSDRELEIAHEVQERLFPQLVPAMQGVTLAGKCRPAHGVGGDYYDMIELESGGLALAIGDVSGKGIPAALLMASLRSCLRTMTHVSRKEMAELDLAALMRELNHLVYESSAVNRYATFFFGVYDPCTRVLRYVNGGHNPPVLLRRRDGTIERILLEATGSVVGLLQNVDFEQRCLTLQPGDVMLAYTDGISEALNPHEEEWGEERMLLTAESAGPACADEILGAVFNAASQFIGSAPQYDDMTLLVITVS